MPKNTSTSLHAIKMGKPGVPASQLIVLSEGYDPAYAAGSDGHWGWFLIVPNTKSDGTTGTALWTHPGNVANCAYLDGHVAGEPAKLLGWDVRNGVWMPGTYNNFQDKAPWYLSLTAH
jgi:prepilin-type processing-associated H-X9-DG protein